MMTFTDRKSASGTKQYFNKQERIEGKDAFGVRFFGQIARDLGILGQGFKSVFHALVGNRTPDGDKLTPRDGGKDRVIGKEVTINAPKGTSLAAVFAPGGEKIVEAFVKSVEETLIAIAEPAAEVRIHDGKKTTNAPGHGLLMSLHVHFASRNLDPQLHGHALIHNCTKTPDGKRLALKSTQIHNLAWEMQADFHKRFRARVEDMGFRTVSKGAFWDLKDIPGSTIRKFSSRREQIEQLYSSVQKVTPALRQKAGLMTRKPKSEVIDLDQIRKDWVGRLTDKERHVFKHLQAKPKVGRATKRRKAYLTALRGREQQQDKGRDRGTGLDR